MAFSLGATPAFGSSAPAFGASSTPAFGAASPPLFGASSASSFGFGAAPAATPATFSFAAATPSLFGTPAAGAAVSASAFGSTPAPSLFGSTLAASSPSLIPAAASPSPFGATSPSLFGAPGGVAAASSPFGTTSLFGAPQAQQQQQQQSLITYSTRYDDLPADKQRELQEIQREIGNYREDCEKLDRDQRLHDSLLLKKNMEEETGNLKQSLQGMLNSIRADDEALADFREKVLKLMRSTEYAVRTFQRAKLWREAPQQYRGQIVPAQVQELLSSPVLLPSPYVEQAIQGFQQTLENYRQVIGQLEQAVPTDIMASLGSCDESTTVQALPLVISHMHDYFVHVAAHMEQLHQEVQKSKDSFINARRSEGNYSDPFEESKRYLASNPGRVDGRGTPGGTSYAQSSPQQHHHHYAANVPVTPTQGAPMQGATPGIPFSVPPTPFGTPFGGAISPAATDMNRNTSSRRSRR